MFARLASCAQNYHSGTRTSKSFSIKRAEGGASRAFRGASQNRLSKKEESGGSTHYKTKKICCPAEDDLFRTSLIRPYYGENSTKDAAAAPTEGRKGTHKGPSRDR